MPHDYQLLSFVIIPLCVLILLTILMKKRSKRIWISKWIELRGTNGVYHQLLRELEKEDPKNFKNLKTKRSKTELINFLDQLGNIDHTWTKDLNETCVASFTLLFNSWFKKFLDQVAWSRKLPVWYRLNAWWLPMV